MAKNLKRLYAVIGADLDDDQMAESVNELNAYIDTLRRIPIELRWRIRDLVERATHMADTRAVQNDPLTGTTILLSDFAKSHSLSPWKVRQIVGELAAHNVARMDEMELDERMHTAIRIDGCAVEWYGNIAEFCSRTDTHVEGFIENLDFSPFDD